VLVLNFNIVCIAIVPLKIHSILIVNPNRVLSFSIFTQLVKFVTRRHFQIVEFCRCMHHIELHLARSANVHPSLGCRDFREFQVRKRGPFSDLVFLLHRPFPTVVFRLPPPNRMKRPVGIFEDESNLVAEANPVTERF